MMPSQLPCLTFNASGHALTMAVKRGIFKAQLWLHELVVDANVAERAHIFHSKGYIHKLCLT